MNIEENIKLFQQYQKSNKLEKASEMVDAIADTHKTDGRTVLCANQRKRKTFKRSSTATSRSS